MLLELIGIRSRVKSNFNQQDDDSFVTNSEIDNFANEGYYHYVNQLIDAEQGFFETTKLLDIVANVETVALPSNFAVNQISHHRTVRLERVFSDRRIPMSHIRRNGNEPVMTTGGSGIGYIPTYDFRGNNIVLEPTPSVSETGGLFLVYGGLPPKLVTGTAEAGGASTITLAAGVDPRDDYFNGAQLLIVSGTGAGQIRTISDYVGSTRVATVSAAWGTPPDTTSVYSLLIHSDFPEMFHDLIPGYATKRVFLKERSRGIAASFDDSVLKEMERDFKNFINERTAARSFVTPWHI